MTKDVAAATWPTLTLSGGVYYSDATKAPDSTAPTTPGTPTVIGSSPDALIITWAASTDAHDILRYDVYRATASGGTYTKVGETGTTSYQDTGLAASTAYYYKIKAVDGSPAANVSSFSSFGTGTTLANTTPGGWQLAAGHYVTSRFQPTLNHPRPDAETYTHERHRWAYYDGVNSLEYRLPICIVGGSPPMHYTLVSAPAGMTVGADPADGINYGVIRWTPSGTVTNATVSFKVEGQDGTVVEGSFTISTSSSTDHFIFVSSSGNNANSGTISSPLLNTRGWFKDDENDTTFSGRIVYYRAGTHAWYLDPNNTNPGNGTFKYENKPLAHLAYPGETVSFDMSQCKLFIDVGVNGLYFEGVEFKNSRKLKTRHFIYFQGENHNLAGGGERVTFFRCGFRNHQPTRALEEEDLNGINGRDEQYQWASEGPGAGYYLRINDGSEAFPDFTGSNDAPERVYSDYVTFTTLAKVASTAVIGLGQWQWVKRAGATGFTIRVRLLDDSDPTALGAGKILVGPGSGGSRPWSTNVGDNAGSVWGFAASGGANDGQRRYFSFSGCTASYIGLIEETTGRVFHNGSNGAEMFLLSNQHYLLNEGTVYTNCQAQAIGRPKSACKYWTMRFLDSGDASNAIVGSLTLPTENAYDPRVLSPPMEVCWSILRHSSAASNIAAIKFGVSGYDTKALTSDGLFSYRNTIICATGRAAYMQQGSHNTDIVNDLIVTNDTDGWYLFTNQSIPEGQSIGNLDFLRIALTDSSTIASTFESDWAIKPTAPAIGGTAIYGTYGATIA